MKPIRTPRPAPRTLAAAPPSGLRAPQPAAAVGHRIPTLAALLAAGAAAPGCADPVCGATRAHELEAHGAAGVQAARGGEASRAVREIGVALGVVNHEATRVPDMVAAGAAPVVQLTPPPRVPDPVGVSGGAVPPVTPQPVPPPDPSQVTTPGNEHPPMRPGQMRRVTPTPPPPPPPPPRPRTEPGIAVPGGLGAVGPLPAVLPRTRPS